MNDLFCRISAPDMNTAAKDWTVYDRADLRDTLSLPKPCGRREVLIVLQGLHCASCAARLEKTLNGRVQDIRINLPARTVEFSWVPLQESLSNILQLLEQSGFEPQVLGQDATLLQQAEEQCAALRRIGVAAICAMQVMMLAWPSYFNAHDISPAISSLLRFAQWLLATPAVLYAGWPFFLNAWQAVRIRAINMDVPVALALTVAYLTSAWRTIAGSGEIYFDTASMFVLLLAGGRYLEGRTRAIAGERLRVLAGRRALTATRVTATGREQVPISALIPGDHVLVPPGEAVPVDGELLDHAAELDESLLTGESNPVPRTRADHLFAGSINLGVASLSLRAGNVGSESMLSQIVRLLNHAQSERPRFQVLADRISSGFVAGVMLLAALAAAYWWPAGTDRSLSVALAVLVASCPCALALAVPAVFAAASSHLAARGILVIRPEALARLPQVDTVLFDKTGTLTSNEFQIRAIEIIGHITKSDCLKIAGTLERDSTHPIARAFSNMLSGVTVQNLQRESARGVSGDIENQHFWLGAADLATPCVLEELTSAQLRHESPLTWLALIGNGKPLALIGLAASTRPEASRVTAKLRAAGLRLELLTGDSADSAQPLAQALKLDAHAARQSPADKLAYLRALQQKGHVVMAVGDGINDAPFLAAADVAVSMPMGAALAQSHADAVLLGNNLKGLVLMRNVALRSQQLTRQNIAWALIYNLTVLPLAMAGLLTPWLAAFGMSLSSVLVVVNALRIGTFLPFRYATITTHISTEAEAC